MRGQEYCSWYVTDKNIKLHIVTDIKVTINSLSAFGFRYLVGGAGLFINNENGISDSFTRSLTYVKFLSSLRMDPTMVTATMEGISQYHEILSHHKAPSKNI